jgi:hypothetical protein
MMLFQGFKKFELVMLTGFVLSGCVTGHSDGQNSASPISPTKQTDGQATTVTADGQVKHQEYCVPVAEIDRVQSPSVEMGVSRNLAEEYTVQPYTRFNCR